MRVFFCVALLLVAIPAYAEDQSHSKNAVNHLNSPDNYQATGVVLLPRDEYEAIPLIGEPDPSKKAQTQSNPNSTVIYKKK